MAAVLSIPIAAIVRVTLRPLGVSADTANDRQIVLDLKIDRSTRAACGPFPAFGRVGDFRKPDGLYPFTLMFDGRMDYGAHAADAARQDRLDIRGAAVIEGAHIAHHSAGVGLPYAIVSVTDIVTD